MSLRYVGTVASDQRHSRDSSSIHNRRVVPGTPKGHKASVGRQLYREVGLVELN